MASIFQTRARHEKIAEKFIEKFSKFSSKIDIFYFSTTYRAA